MEEKRTLTPASSDDGPPLQGGAALPCAPAAASCVLPPVGTVRWVARRKEQVVTAVRDGLLTLDEARSRYALSPEEFRGWQERYALEGIRGLHVRTRRPD